MLFWCDSSSLMTLLQCLPQLWGELHNCQGWTGNRAMLGGPMDFSYLIPSFLLLTLSPKVPLAWKYRDVGWDQKGPPMELGVRELRGHNLGCSAATDSELEPAQDTGPFPYWKECLHSCKLFACQMMLIFTTTGCSKNNYSFLIIIVIADEDW